MRRIFSDRFLNFIIVSVDCKFYPACLAQSPMEFL